MITMCLTFLLLVADQRIVAPISIAVVASKGVTDSLVRLICAEAQAIWRPAGIAFEWRRVTSNNEARRWSLEIAIDDRRSSVHPDDALGWLTFTNDDPDRVIHLSRAAAEGLLRNTPGLPNTTIVSHEILLGRALGRALAHECGHYLLRSKGHTTRGLMRAAWHSDEFFAFNSNGFELTPEQRAAAFDNVRIDSGTAR
jgi:hypothetical protein